MTTSLARNLFVGLLMLAPCHSAWANDVFVPCRPGATVFYINGVDKPDEQEVSNSAAILAENIAHFSVTCVADVRYFYNPSDGLLSDVLGESATQVATELKIGFADALLQVGYAAFGHISTLSEADIASIRQKISALIQNVSLSSYTFVIDGVTYTTADLVADFRDSVLTELGQGTKTILVGHSQGNFFANETYTAVLAAAPIAVSQGLAIVNVANAAADAPSGLWVTTSQDLAVKVIPGAMSSNFDATGSYTYDLLGHSFDEIYMNRELPTGATESNSVAARVVALLQMALNEAQPPVGVIYGCTSYSLFTLNLATRAATVLGYFTYTNSAAVPVWDIAVNPRGGPTYAISGYAVSTVNQSSLTLLLLPQSTVGGNALGFNADAELYSMNGSSVYQVDTASGVATPLPISLGAYQSSGDLTFDSNGLMLATATGPGGVDYLIQVDVKRLTVKVVGPTGYSALYGLYFSGGYLFGVTNSGNVISIDTATGAGKTVGQLPFGDITGLQ